MVESSFPSFHEGGLLQYLSRFDLTLIKQRGVIIVSDLVLLLLLFDEFLNVRVSLPFMLADQGLENVLWVYIVFELLCLVLLRSFGVIL